MHSFTSTMERGGDFRSLGRRFNRDFVVVAGNVVITLLLLVLLLLLLRRRRCWMVGAVNHPCNAVRREGAVVVIPLLVVQALLLDDQAGNVGI